eukprot:830233-Rhodomonas_salina.1
MVWTQKWHVKRTAFVHSVTIMRSITVIVGLSAGFSSAVVVLVACLSASFLPSGKPSSLHMFDSSLLSIILACIANILGGPASETGFWGTLLYAADGWGPLPVAGPASHFWSYQSSQAW